MKPTHIRPDVVVGDGERLLVIAGPCLLESEELSLIVAEACRSIASKLDVTYVFKGSFDKANRTSIDSARGPGIDEGLRILECVRDSLQIPVTTDVHDIDQVEAAAEVVDLLQIPALLSRQTDLLTMSAKTGRAVNVKKGQFLAPWDMKPLVQKLERNGAKDILLTERGTTFGYNSLVVDFRSIQEMHKTGHPVIFDATHSVQEPSGRGSSSGGDRSSIAPLALAAVAAGVDGLFLEVHPDPDHALSDGPSMLPLQQLGPLLTRAVAVRSAVLQSG